MEPKAKRVCLETIPSSMKIQEDKDNYEDKLSSLHESVLSIILSKLPTIDAVRTCVLSKSWRNMWTNITNLQFDDKNEYQFIEFINHVLRDIGNMNINSFHLHSVNHLRDSRLLILWLSKVLNCNLQILELDITWHNSERVHFTRIFASFGSLVELRLHINSILYISAPVFLQNLKFFSLKGVKISNKSRISKDLLLKFPVLETFIVSNCFFVNTNTVILDSPLLKIFEILNCYFMNEANGSRVCKIRVLTSNLEKVTFLGINPEKFLLDFPPSLPDAHLSLCTTKWPVKFIESFTCVKSLYFEIKQLTHRVVNDFEEIKITVFRHLIHLDLVYDMTQHSKFMTLLDSTPILEKLSLQDLTPTPMVLILTPPEQDLARSNPSSKALRKLIPKIAPDCIQTTLKVFQIRNFETNKLQLAVLKYVMENAKNLESVTLHTPQTIEEEGKAMILSYPKASPRASVVFECSI